MKSGFVNIFGKPNAGKSTLLNALMGEKLAIVSSKVQTTRHRIKAFLTKPGEYQIVFSDTPGIIQPKYKLHEKMMLSVKSALEDADIALLIADVSDNKIEVNELFKNLKLNVHSILILNKIDKVSSKKVDELMSFYKEQPYGKNLVTISALKQPNLDELLNKIIELLPEGEPFYNEDELTDLPTKFFCKRISARKNI